MSKIDIFSGETKGVRLALAAQERGLLANVELQKVEFKDKGIGIKVLFKRTVPHDVWVPVIDQNGVQVVDPATGEVQLKLAASAGDTITDAYWARRDASPEDLEKLKTFKPVDVEVNWGVYIEPGKAPRVAEKAAWVAIYDKDNNSLSLSGERKYRGDTAEISAAPAPKGE